MTTITARFMKSCLSFEGSYIEGLTVDQCCIKLVLSLGEWGDCMPCEKKSIVLAQVFF